MHQRAILDPVPAAGVHLTFHLVPGVGAAAIRAALGRIPALPGAIVGVGLPAVAAIGAAVDGLTAFPAMAGPGVAVPSTQGALWAFCGASEPGVARENACAIADAVAPGFALTDELATFVYRGGRDLTGYEDGTENPKGEAAIAAALGPGGASFVAVQRWLHDLRGFAARTGPECDAIIGRRRADNVELPDAPVHAHVRRTAQESFEPAAFMVRRSMPFGGVGQAGLQFVAFGASTSAFERAMRRMAGLEDGVPDALFQFSRPVTGGYYWCPPLADDRLDLGALA
jgi:putative iron-dependent peroxidase